MATKHIIVDCHYRRFLQLLVLLTVLFFFGCSEGTAFHLPIFFTTISGITCTSKAVPSSNSVTSSTTMPLTSETVNDINESEPSASNAQSKESESSPKNDAEKHLALPEATNDPSIPSIKLGGMYSYYLIRVFFNVTHNQINVIV